MPRHSPESFLSACGPGPVLALDVSARRIGVATTNPERTMALPVKTLMRGKWAGDAAALLALFREGRAAGLVIGLPLLADGRMGPAAQSRLTFARNLDTALSESGRPLPYVMVDEALTTAEARGQLAHVSKAKNELDQWAAVLLLQQFLKI